MTIARVTAGMALSIYVTFSHADGTAIPSGPLLEATSIRYNQMKAAGIEQQKYDTECCFWFASVGTPWSERSYPTDKAYFVRLKIDARALASVLLKDSCERHGIFDSSTECSQEELSRKVEETLAHNRTGDLYGKYRVGFNAYNDGELIRHTEKFGGYGIYQFKREKGIDEVVVGPMPGNPTRFVLGEKIGSAVVMDFRR